MKRLTALLLSDSLLLSLSACGTGTAGPSEHPGDGPTVLSQEELDRANDAFASTVEVTTGDLTTVYSSEISCFFTSYYETPSEIDLAEFLCYCPIGDVLEDIDADEYRAVMAASGFGDVEQFPLPGDLFVPVHRYPAGDLSTLLQTYANVALTDLTHTDGVTYLEEYDAYYNFTSDFGPGMFTAERGVKEGDAIRFTSAPFEDGSADELTVQKVGDTYFIQSFLNRPEGGS